MKLGYIGIDQYGDTWKIKRHPRKELCEQLGIKHAEKMYTDTVDSAQGKHVGYLIGQRWIAVYEVHEWTGNSAN